MVLDGDGGSSYGGEDSWPLLHAAFMSCALTAILGGTYSVVVFTLSSLYGKTALGMRRDDMYNQFMMGTGGARFRAFNAFKLSLWSFCIQVVILFAERSVSRIRAAVLIIGFVAVEFGRRDCNLLIRAATPMFFPPPPAITDEE